MPNLYITTTLDKNHAHVAGAVDMCITSTQRRLVDLLRQIGHAVALPCEDGSILLVGIGRLGYVATRVIELSEGEHTVVPFRSQTQVDKETGKPVIHHATIDNERGKVFCECQGYTKHKKCWHSTELAAAMRVILHSDDGAAAFERMVAEANTELFA